MKEPCAKLAYSKNQIKEARRRIYKQRNARLRTYECPNCGKWHLTSQFVEFRKNKK